MLIVLGGLPGVGKTTIARELARAAGAIHLRIDSIEQALRTSSATEIAMEDAGYRVAYAVAGDNLRLGRTVIADCVNPLPITREAWLATSKAAGARAFEIEIVCSDPREHRRRVEHRELDVPGLMPPSWAEVVARDYRPWTAADLVVDTALRTPAECVAEILGHFARRGVRPSE